MQQLSGSSGRGGTQTPASRVLLRWISDRRSSGEESREENKIAGPEGSASSSAELSGTEVGGGVRGDAVVGGLLFILGVGVSRRAV